MADAGEYCSGATSSSPSLQCLRTKFFFAIPVPGSDHSHSQTSTCPVSGFSFLEKNILLSLTSFVPEMGGALPVRISERKGGA